MRNELQKTTENFSINELQVYDFDSMSTFLGKLIESKALPPYVSSPERAFSMITFGSELGFLPMESLHYLTLVNGVFAPNGKGVNKILSMNDIYFKPIFSAAYIYSDGSNEIYSERPLHIYEILAQLNIELEEYKSYSTTKQTFISEFRDRITRLEYGVKISSSDYKKLGEFDYYWSHAVESDLSSKDTYKKYPRDMMMYRAKVQIAKNLGILTVPTSEEIASSRNIATEIVDGSPEVVETEFKEV